MRALPVQARNSPEIHAGYGAHGKPANGDRTGGCGMGAAQDDAAGKRDTPTFTEGGEIMTGAEVDEIVEAEDAKAWEDLNAEDPHTQKAVELLKQATDMLEQVENLVTDAADAVGGTFETHRVASLNIDTGALLIALRMQIERMER